MPDAADGEAIRRRVQGWRAAELRELELRRQEAPLDPEASLEASLELCDLLGDGAFVADAVREREVAQARVAWAKLRAYFACPTNPPRR